MLHLHVPLSFMNRFNQTESAVFQTSDAVFSFQIIYISQYIIAAVVPCSAPKAPQPPPPPPPRHTTIHRYSELSVLHFLAPWYCRVNSNMKLVYTLYMPHRV